MHQAYQTNDLKQKASGEAKAALEETIAAVEAQNPEPQIDFNPPPAAPPV